MEAGKLVATYITRRHNPEDQELYFYRCENLQSHIASVRI
jgi:hypothetical protein